MSVYGVGVGVSIGEGVGKRIRISRFHHSTSVQVGVMEDTLLQCMAEVALAEE